MIRVRAHLATAGAVALFALGGTGFALAADNEHSAPTAPSHPVVAASPDSTDTTTTSGDTNTNNFGSKVQAQIKVCKAARPTTGGKQGIGECLSDWVTQNNPGHTGKHSGH